MEEKHLHIGDNVKLINDKFEIICGHKVPDAVGTITDLVKYFPIAGMSTYLLVVTFPDETEVVCSEHSVEKAK